MSDIKRVYSQPTFSSLKEGEEVIYLGKSKPLARYRKENGQIWVSYMTTNGDLFVEKDFNVQGTISQGGTGGGSGNPIVKGGLVEQTAGGVGVSTAGTTGAVSYNSGTPSVGTLGADKGGTGQDLSSGTGLIKVSSGTVSASALVNADISGSAAIDAAKITAGVLPTAQHSAHVTDNLDANGLKTGRNIGDAVKGFTIFNSSQIAGSSDSNTVASDNIWQQTNTTPVIKVLFNYVHDDDNSTMKLRCLLRTSSGSSGDNVIAKLTIYDVSVGASLTTGSAPNVSSDKVTPVTISTNKTGYAATATSSDMDISSLTNGTMYKVAILLYNEGSSATSYLTGPAVTVNG